MNWLDIAVFATLGLGAIVGTLQGFLRLVLYFVAIAGAAWVTARYYDETLPFFVEQVGEGREAQGLTIVALFIGSAALFFIIRHFASKALRGGALSALDRSLGFAAGLGLGVTVVGLEHRLLLWYVDTAPQPAWLAEARTLPFQNWAGNLVDGFIPETDVTGLLPTLTPVGPAPRDVSARAPGGETGYSEEQRGALESLAGQAAAGTDPAAPQAATPQPDLRPSATPTTP